MRGKKVKVIESPILCNDTWLTKPSESKLKRCRCGAHVWVETYWIVIGWDGRKVLFPMTYCANCDFVAPRDYFNGE